MKTNQRLAWLASLVTLFSALNLSAEEVATVKDGRVNVRGQPSLVGEVITQLQKGEKVVVLDEITVANPKTNEPPKWARIQMPPNTPVWVYAPFLDTNKTVKVSRLNLRAGPGENFSVVGRLERGTSVTEIRRVEEWVEIEMPAGAYAFVAADLLTKGEPAPAPVVAPKQESPAKAPLLASKAAREPAPKQEPPPVIVPTQTKPAEPPPVPAQTEPVTPPPQKIQTPATAAVSTPPKTEPPPVVPNPLTAAVASAATTPTVDSPAAKPEEARPRRIVRREGLVRSTVSVQAPSYYELLSPQNHRTINFLHSEQGIDLKNYRGHVIVVTGEEAIDPRWPKIPVVEVESIELVP